MKEKVIEIKNLHKKVDNIQILNSVNLSVKEGDIFGLLGKNGAGKSTIMKIILGLTSFDNGLVKLFNKYDIRESNKYLSYVGSLIEEPAFYPNLTAFENLKVIQMLANLREENIFLVLKMVGLDNQKAKLVKNYSLGMKQRLGIAMAMIKFPKLLILDEPTNGLDPQGVSEIRKIIKELPQKYGTTVLISSHILTEIEKTANKVAILDQGRIRYKNEISAIKSNKLIIKADNFLMAKKLLNNYDIQVRGNEIIINDINREEAIIVNKMLTKHNADVFDLHFKEENLEDIFLSMTVHKND